MRCCAVCFFLIEQKVLFSEKATDGPDPVRKVTLGFEPYRFIARRTVVRKLARVLAGELYGDETWMLLLL